MSARYLGGVIAQTQLPLNPAAGNAANGVFTLEQYMQAVKNATWPSFDPYFNETVLLLHGNGTNGAQNNTFLDSSSNNFTITRNGNTTQGTFSPFSVAAGEWSNYFDGSGDYLRVAYNAAFTWSTAAITIECWCYPVSTKTYNPLFSMSNDVGANQYEVYLNSSNQVVFRYWNGSSQTVTTSSSVLLNVWAHVAFVYDGSSAITIYINGISSGTGTKTGTPITDNTPFNIGRTRYGNSSTTEEFFNGYISNLRVVNSQEYTTTFTPPPTPLTAITNTSLLTCQSNRFVDNSTNNFTITPNGDVRVTPFSPFAPTAAYFAGTNGGSGYFDGTGDYLSMSSNAAFTVGTGAVTIEAWIYCTSLSQAYQGIVSGRTFDNNVFPGLALTIDNSKLFFTIMNSGDGLVDTVNVPLNQWVHVVGVRNGSSNAALFVNGVRKAYNANLTVNGTTSAMNIGRYYPTVDNYYFSGWISNVRIVKGYAEYDPTQTTLSVPTSPVTSVTGTSLLCNFTNAGIIDNTGKNNLETVGNAQIDTTTKKFGDGSMEFDGSGDWLLIPRSPDIEGLLTTYTIEGWIYPTNTNSGFRAIFVIQAALVTNYGTFELYQSGTTLGFAIRPTTGGSITSITGGTLVANTWQHIAISVANTSGKLYLNGEQVGSTTTMPNYSFAINTISVGGHPNQTAEGFVGFIDDLRITKGVARYTANFAVPYLPQGPLPLVGGPYIPNTVLMLPGTGTNGAQNNTFLDSSTNNFTITRNGNTTQGTFSPFSRANGYWGNYFDGTDDYLDAGDNAAFEFGSGNFCIEAWVYLTSTTSGQTIASKWTSTGISNSNSWIFFFESGALTFLTSTNGSSNDVNLSGGTPQLNTWNHCAICRSGNTYGLFLNGSRVATTTNSNSLFDASVTLKVGRFSAGFLYQLIGYISNLRVVKGSAVYDPTQTTLTVPTTPLTAIANTSLLTCQSNRFIDNSTNNFTITRNGDVRVVTFSPFEYLTAYSPATNGGSGYFDGTGDWLTIPSNAAFQFGTGDFTIECWINKATAANGPIIDARGASTAAPYAFYVDGSNFPYFYDGSSYVSSVAITNSQWNHIAVTRSSNTLRIFVNGVQGYSNTVTTALNPSSTVFIGGQNFSSPATTTGYIADLRIVKGTAVYTSAFTPPTAPLTAITNTSLLCNFTNAGIYDASMTNDLETVGNAQVSTTQSKWGGGSMYFDGTGDWLLVRDDPNLQFRTGAFTIEAWVYPTGGSGNFRGIVSKGNATGDWSLGISNGNVFYWSTGISNFTGTTTVVLNTWYHVAVVRSGTTVNLYVNGISEVTQTLSNDYALTTPLYVGCGRVADIPFTGYISDLRILKGVAILPTPLQTSQWQDQ